jgi:CRP/FNR family transcriptional regulator, cyclic AMP receptor protein
MSTLSLAAKGLFSPWGRIGASSGRGIDRPRAEGEVVAPLLTGTAHKTRRRPVPHARSQGEVAAFDPLYLFACGLKWHREGDPSAGWELIGGARSDDRNARIIAAELLAKTRHSRLRLPDLRQARRRARKVETAKPREENLNKGPMMNTPYGLEMIENCMSCELRREQWFCGFSRESLQVLDDMSHLTTYPGGALLFVEGQVPRGAYLLCSGRAKVSTTSREGKVLILKYAEAGEVLGLSAVISGEPFEVTAETAGPCQVNFVEREALIQRIGGSGELGLQCSQALSREFQLTYRDLHDLVLARSSAGKLAKLLVSWMPQSERPAEAGEIRIRQSPTHEEMAQMIGSSRETVTRLMGDLKKKELIRLEGSTLVIRNRIALEAMAA